MNKPIDIFICAYLRPMFTEQTIVYLKERTKTPYRLFLINNGGNDEIAKVYKDDIFMTINLSKNAGVHAAWNIALSLAESDYFITTDNDIYVPDLSKHVFAMVPNEGNIPSIKAMEVGEGSKDWLERLIDLMDQRPDFGAISLSPHVLIGDAPMDVNDPEDVRQVSWCGAVMRIMRKSVVAKTGGWNSEGEPLIQANRGHEERTICGKLNQLGYKSGRCTRLRAYHPFGKAVGGNWGYPEEITPEMQGHNPELKDYVQQFDNMEAYDEKTWLPK